MQLSELYNKFKMMPLKHLLIVVLLILSAVNYQVVGLDYLPFWLLIVFSTLASDSVIKYIDEKKLIVSDSAMVSALIIGGVFFTQDFLVASLVGPIAMLGKRIIKINKGHIFNPANFGIFLTSLLFANASQSWWFTGSLFIVAVFYLTYRQRTLWSVTVPFLAILTALFGVQAFLSTGSIGFGFVQAFVLDPTTFFFACIMLVEPMTLPRRKGRMIFASIAALATFALSFTPWGLGVIGGLVVADLFVPLLNRFVK